MAIGFRTVLTTTFSTSGNSSFGFSTPSSAVQGDVLIAVFTYNTNVSADVANTIPSGWTSADGSNGVCDVSTGNGSPHIIVAWKVAVGGTESFTWTTASAVAYAFINVFAYTGVDQAKPFDQFAYGTETGGGVTSHTMPSITPTVGGSWLFCGSMDRTNNGITSPIAGSPTLTARISNAQTGVTAAVACNIEIDDSNGSTVPRSATSYTETTGASTSVQSYWMSNLNPAGPPRQESNPRRKPVQPRTKRPRHHDGPSAPAQGGVWATAWAARATAPATWLALGDSITEGQGASVLANRWTNQCLTLLRSRPGSPSTVGGAGWCPAGGLTVGPDSAWTSPTSPVPAYTGSAAAGYFWQTLDGKASTTNATNDTITWTTKGTSYDTWVIDSTATGTYQVDALSAVALTNGGAFPTLRVQHTAGVSSATHTVQIKQTGAGVIGVDGIFAYDGDESNGVHLWNTGHYGALLSDLLGDWGTGDIYTYLQPFWIGQVAPDVVTIGFGTNEFLNNISPTTFTANMRRLIQILQSLPKIPTVYLLAMPTYDDGSTHTFRWATYQAALQQLAAESPGVTYVDVMAVTGVPTSGGLFSSDQIHPSNSGHALIGQFMSGVLGGNPALPSMPHKRPRRHLPPVRRAADRMPVPAQQTPAPAWVPQRRAPLRVLVALRRRRGDSDGPLTGQDVPQVQGRRRPPLLRRRPAAVVPVPAQQIPAPPYPARPSNPRRMGRRLARPTVVTPVPAQVVPPPAWVPVRPAVRRIVAVLRRQHTAAAPLDQAGAPAAARVRMRPTLRRRPSVAGPVPVQVAVAPSWVPQRGAPRRLLAAVVRRQHGDTAPPVDQPGPIPAPARRWRAPWRRRPATVTPVPPQLFVGPAYPPAPSNPRRMGRLPRRGRTATPVPAPQFVGPPFVPQKSTPRRVLAAVRRRAAAGPPVDQAAAVAGPARRLRFLWRRRPAVVAPVPVQEAPPRPAPGRHPAAPPTRARRSVSPPIPQAAPPPAKPTRARPVTFRARRGRTAQPARPQDVIPAYPVRPSNPRRVLAAVRGLRRLTPKWIGVGLPAGVRPGRAAAGGTQGASVDGGTTKGSQMTAGYRTDAAADTADEA